MKQKEDDGLIEAGVGKAECDRIAKVQIERQRWGKLAPEVLQLDRQNVDDI